MDKVVDPGNIDIQWFAEGDEITIEQVREFLIQNKEKPEVASLFVELNPREPVTADEVSAYLETKEGQALIQPYGDKRVTAAIDTYKKGKFEAEVKARVAAELLKANPAETPEQKQIRELREEMATDKIEREAETLRGQIKELAFTEQVNPKFISGIKFGSLEEAALYIKDLKGELEAAKTKVTNELIANGSYKPKTGEPKDKNKIDVSKLSLDEAIELEMKGELDAQIRI